MDRNTILRVAISVMVCLLPQIQVSAQQFGAVLRHNSERSENAAVGLNGIFLLERESAVPIENSISPTKDKVRSRRRANHSVVGR